MNFCASDSKGIDTWTFLYWANIKYFTLFGRFTSPSHRHGIDIVVLAFERKLGRMGNRRDRLAVLFQQSQAVRSSRDRPVDRVDRHTMGRRSDTEDDAGKLVLVTNYSPTRLTARSSSRRI